jgi:hypothetical protein
VLISLQTLNPQNDNPNLSWLRLVDNDRTRKQEYEKKKMIKKNKKTRYELPGSLKYKSAEDWR